MTINQLEKAQHLQNEFNVTLDILNKEWLELTKRCYSTAPLGKPRSRLANALFIHIDKVFNEAEAGLRIQYEQKLAAI